MSNEQPTKPAPVQPSNQLPVQPQKKIVWMSCRASEKCEGKQAYIVMERKVPLAGGGGTSRRYRCLLCKGVWHITV